MANDVCQRRPVQYRCFKLKTFFSHWPLIRTYISLLYHLLHGNPNSFLRRTFSKNSEPRNSSRQPDLTKMAPIFYHSRFKSLIPPFNHGNHLSRRFETAAFILITGQFHMNSSVLTIEIVRIPPQSFYYGAKMPMHRTHAFITSYISNNIFGHADPDRQPFIPSSRRSR